MIFFFYITLFYRTLLKNYSKKVAPTVLSWLIHGDCVTVILTGTGCPFNHRWMEKRGRAKHLRRLSKTPETGNKRRSAERLPVSAGCGGWGGLVDLRSLTTRYLSILDSLDLDDFTIRHISSTLFLYKLCIYQSDNSQAELSR